MMDSDSKIGTVADLIADYPSRQRKVENDFSEVVVPEMSDRAKASFESLGLLEDVEMVRRQLRDAKTKSAVDVLNSKLAVMKTLVSVLKLASETNERIGESRDENDIEGIEIHLVRSADDSGAKIKS